MQVSAAISFWDELHKIAATVEQLHAARNRLGIVRMPVPGGLTMSGGKLKVTGSPALPTQALEKRVLSKGSLPAQALIGGGVATVMPGKLLRGASGDRMISQKMQQLGVAARDRPEATQTVRKEIATATQQPIYKRHGGMLIQSKGDTAARIGQAMGFPPMSGEGRKASNVMLGLHEGFERKAIGRPREVATGFGHLSPRVIMDEQNLANKMTGPGSDEARTFQKAIRGKAGETAALEHALKTTYGQRGVDYVKKHGYTKAMKKDLMRRYASGELEFATPKPEKSLKKSLLERRKARVATRSREKAIALGKLRGGASPKGGAWSKAQRMARKLFLRR